MLLCGVLTCPFTLFFSSFASPIVFVPDEPGHARKIVKTYNVSQIDGIVVAAGDGVINEVSLSCITAK